ncbi:MAG: hypothetical protein K2M60_00095 [Lachnospiraceae bacterium]|nr:hypothetical protein [Lachnospiraceae bacterium]MDE6252929.1 hypothetical protein [Lachnospiraceae bacterium]
MDNEKWWKQLKSFRLAPNWKIMWNKLKDIEPDKVNDDDDAWLFTFVEDMTYITTEYTYKENKKTIKHTLAVDLSWYPEGDVKGHYHLVAILDNNWNKPILEMKTRSTQKVVDTIELWLFETLINWENRIYMNE